MTGLIEEHRADIDVLCRQYGVLRLDIFGSAATGEFNAATSDLDFIATFADTETPGYARRYLAFAEALEALFNRPVDVLIEGSIRNPYFRASVAATRQQVFVERDPTSDPHPNPSPCAQGEGLWRSAESRRLKFVTAWRE
jgi:predicted nucleotidyltransferase